MERERPQSEANLENDEGQGEGLPHYDKRGSFKGLRRNTQTGGLGRLTDCKIQPKGHTLTQ